MCLCSIGGIMDFKHGNDKPNLIHMEVRKLESYIRPKYQNSRLLALLWNYEQVLSAFFAM